jgi:tRNA A58 N-methylase Trm61
MGYLFSHAKQLIGIELNKTFASLAQQIVTDFKFADRIKIINDNILNQADILASADIVILNNVFEWFTTQEELRNMWAFIVKSINKKGTIIVTSPSIEESLAHAQVHINASFMIVLLLSMRVCGAFQPIADLFSSFFFHPDQGHRYHHLGQEA